ncbi:MAG: hypothetical protein PHR61_01955 [Candidatus Absconditabacteria bacterium]|nr:hypothetical protein [Candidatus Absconditabacteria bacterium]
MKDIYVVFDESINSCLTSLSCIVFEDSELFSSIFKIINIIKAKPGHKTENFPHYAYDAYTLRSFFIDEIRKLQFRSYIVFSNNERESESTEKIYDVFLINLLKPLILKYKNRFKSEIKFHLFFDNIGTKGYFDNILSSIQNFNYEINIIKKNEMGHITAIPDYVCGCLSDFLFNPNPDNPSSQGNTIFINLIDKIGCIKAIIEDKTIFFEFSKRGIRKSFIDKFKGIFKKKQ